MRNLKRSNGYRQTAEEKARAKALRTLGDLANLVHDQARKLNKMVDRLDALIGKLVNTVT